MAPCRMQEILAAGDKVSDAWVSRGSLWGPSVLAGNPLHVLVQVCPSHAHPCMLTGITALLANWNERSLKI